MPSSDADAAHPTLLKARLLRQQREFPEARHLLEKALVQWPQNDEIKALLLETEKDQLAQNCQNKDERDEAGVFEGPWQALFVGVMGVAGASVLLYMIAQTVAFMLRFGFDAPHAMYTRGTRELYYVPAHSTLGFPLFLLCIFVWLIKLAVQSFRSRVY